MACFLFIILVLVSSYQTYAETLISPFLQCYLNNTYRKTSVLDSNINNALANLQTTNNGFGFSKSSVGIESNRVDAAALCLPDISTKACLECIGEGTNFMRKNCPIQRGGVVYYENCSVSYFNLHEDKNMEILDADEATAPEPGLIKPVLRSLLEELITDAAAGGQLLKYSSGNKTDHVSSITVYARVQCRPDFSSLECTDCLTQAITTVYVKLGEEVGNKLGGSFHQPTCSFKYNTSPFFTRTYLNRPPPPTPTKADRSSKMIMIIVALSVILVIQTITSIIVFSRMRKKTHLGIFSEIPMVESLQIPFDQMKASTNNFSESRMLGRGGFGHVYKGTMRNGEDIAVKRLKEDSKQGDKELKNEVMMLKSLHHRNVVTFLGFSTQGRERLLIYECLPNGSLDKFIFDPSKRCILNWETRKKIITDIAKGLHYLHEECPLPIVHRDIKAGNILLDQLWNAKVSDFGIAKFLEPDETHHTTTHIVGTRGYIPPDDCSQKRYSCKTDVYSYGVVVLETISGRKISTLSRNDEHITEDIINIAHEKWKTGTIREMVDSSLNTEPESLQEIARYIHIGLLCIQNNRDSRPNISLVIKWLDNSSSTPLPVILDSSSDLGSSSLPSPNVLPLERNNENTLDTIVELPE